MPLKLSLRPGEKFVVNGAVVQNGDRRAALVLQNKASVLRGKDIMQPEEAATPARRIYFPIMLMYLDERGRDKAYEEFAARLAEFMSAVRDPAVLTECVGVSKEVMAGEYYRALMRCRKLIAYEAERLGLMNAIKGLPAAGTAAEIPARTGIPGVRTSHGRPRAREGSAAHGHNRLGRGARRQS